MESFFLSETCKYLYLVSELFLPYISNLFIYLFLLRIDTGGLSVNCSALFKEAPIKCSLANQYTIYIIK